MFQSSVISWSSKIISDGTFARTRRTCGNTARNSPTFAILVPRLLAHVGVDVGSERRVRGNFGSVAGQSTGDHASRYIAMNSP